MSKRRMYNTTLDTDLIKEIKILAAQLDKRQNDLLEEAIKDLLEKYRCQDQEESFDIDDGQWVPGQSASVNSVMTFIGFFFFFFLIC